MAIRVQQLGWISACCLVLSLSLGCGASEYSPQAEFEDSVGAKAELASLPGPENISDEMATRASRIAGRKIVFTGAISLVVENYSKLESDLTRPFWPMRRSLPIRLNQVR